MFASTWTTAAERDKAISLSTESRVLAPDCLRYDSHGILPLTTETPEGFICRAKRLLEVTPSLETAAYVRELAESALRSGVWALDRDTERMRQRAVAEINDRYRCDLNWVPVFFADLGRPAVLGTVRRGMAFPAWLGPNGIDIHPPVVLLNLHLPPRSSLIRHELLHVVRSSAGFDSGISYKGGSTFEERAANGGWLIENPRTLLVSNVEAGLAENLRIALQYRRAHKLLKRAFGALADYVLVRSSYEEIIDFHLERIHKRDPLEILEMRAGRGDLRYQILLETCAGRSRR